MVYIKGGNRMNAYASELDISGIYKFFLIKNYYFFLYYKGVSKDPNVKLDL